MNVRRFVSARWFLVVGVGLGALAAGGGGSPAAPAVTPRIPVAEAQGSAATPAPKPPMPTIAPHIPEAGPPLPPISYESKGRRDPFTPIAPPVEKSGGVDVNTVKLVGVVEGREPLALIEATGGFGYILKPGDVLGNGRVTDIDRGSVTFAVAGRAGQRDTSVTLRLVKE